MFYSEEDVKGLRMEDLPVWLWSVLVTEDSFVKIPPNFTWPDEEDEPANGGKAAVAAPSGEPEREAPLFRYAKVEIQHCVDSGLGFCGSLAAVYSRILEDRGEKIFLRGDVFLAKIAKAVLEQDGELFAEACEEHKDEAYFRECAVVLEKWGSIVKEDEAMDRSSWISLYEMVLLLTEEYLATKLDNGLPAVEVSVCSGNGEAANLELIITPRSASEEDLNGASMSALESLRDSSDSIVFDDLENSFYKFLRENFPFRDDQNGFKNFFRKIYDEDVCTDGNLNWLYGEFFNGSALGADLLPEKIEIGLMEAEIFGAYKNGNEGRVIYISQRLVLDSLRSQEDSLLLLITLLHEYGHFLDDVLHDRAGPSGDDSAGEEGQAFAVRFMNYSEANLFSKNFEFAKLSTFNAKGEEQKFTIEMSSLNAKHRKGIFSIFEFSEDSEKGNLELPKDETTIIDVEFSKYKNVVNFLSVKIPAIGRNINNFLSATHQKFTKEAIESVGLQCRVEMVVEGSIWPDFPSTAELDTRVFHALNVLRKKVSTEEADIAYESHFGSRQFWHSMCPRLWLEPLLIPSNEDVKKRILRQCKTWYECAIDDSYEEKYRDFAIGKLCHMVQDSFVLAHCWRRHTGDGAFMDEEFKENGRPMVAIRAEDHGKIWTFQDYSAQDSDFHALADSQKQKLHIGSYIPTIGYESAEKATKEIMQKYKERADWNSLETYLDTKVYVILSNRKSLPSGGSHPWFKKDNRYSKSEISKKLSNFSNTIEENYL